MGRDGMKLLQVENVSKRFRGLIAVSDVSLSVDQGEIVGLIGPNGAGKTTLFNIIGGQLAPSSGRIVFMDKDITHLPPFKICNLGIARTFQINKPFGNMTVLESVMIGAFTQEKNTRRARDLAFQKVVLMGLENVADHPVKDLTFASQKKVELARALATCPKLLLLDEVMSGLNPTEVQGMIELVKKVRDTGVTIIFIEHLMAALMSLSDRVIVLHHGTLIGEGSPQEISTNERVVEAYFGGGDSRVKN
jgi:branched-chain amino acid transport system ATP-binding protein